MKIRTVLPRSLVSFALLACSLLIVAHPAAAISLEASDSGWTASENGQNSSGLAVCNAFLRNSKDTTGNIMPGPRAK